MPATEQGRSQPKPTTSDQTSLAAQFASLLESGGYTAGIAIAATRSPKLQNQGA